MMFCEVMCFERVGMMVCETERVGMMSERRVDARGHVRSVDVERMYFVRGLNSLKVKCC